MYLKEWRWQKGWTQNQLSEILGCSQSAIALAEGGKYITRKFAQRLVELFPETKSVIEVKEVLKKK